MKRLTISALLLIGTWVNARGTVRASGQCDADCIRTVKRLLQEREIGGSTGWADKESSRLGDKIGVALSKIYKQKDLAKSKNIRLYLPVIRECFSYPDVISNPEDKNPTFTLPLLRDLEGKVEDPSLKREISELIDWLSHPAKDN